MKNKIIGFIGGGNMATAIIGGILASGLAVKEQILAADKTENALAALRERFGIRTTHSNQEAAEAADILFLAVKPHILPEAIAEMKDNVDADMLLVSIAAGKSIASIESLFGREIKLVRAMPNTPALVGEGMSALCAN